MLDMEIFTYLNRALESSIAPIVVLASNRGLTTEDLMMESSSSRMPPDLIDRLLIVRTLPYNQEEIKTIIGKRASLEGLTLTDDALKLSKQGLTTSLRYAVQLLTPAGVLSTTAGRSEITVQDIEECEFLFWILVVQQKSCKKPKPSLSIG